ncbi:hypothetical protein VM98_28545 [Streptomyces rubellomurinus subsp. indigoferus]|nr:hypothetical protein VM98_28545 [Streptomyces rubellomurinus subsp. indigoferus]
MATSLTRQFVWTVIPAGRVATVDGGQLALCSVLLTPRLLGPADQPLRLSDFGLQAWPQALAAVGFTMNRGDTVVPAQPVPHLDLDGNPTLFTAAQQQSAWSALFPPDLAVRPYQPASYQDRQAVHMPASQAGAQISAAYGQSGSALAAAHQTDPEALRATLRTVNEGWQSGLRPSDTDTGTEPSPLRRAYDFYRRPDSAAAAPPGAPEQPEFHDIVARLADHPMLLRALGLIVDLGVPVAALAPSTAPATLRVTPRWPGSEPTAGWAGAAQDDLSPTTVYTLSGTRFVPAAGSGPQAAPFALGMLALAGAALGAAPGAAPGAALGAAPAGDGANGRFEIMPFDVDGAALRMVGIAASGDGGPASDHADDTGLPALRSAGVALLDTGREQEHDNRLRRAQDRATREGLLGSPLTADNLVAGYRLDVWDDRTRTWRSLCQRRVRYGIGDLQLGGADGLLEEGCVRVDSVTTGAGADSAVYVHQTVARWDGWSAVAPRPDRIAEPVDTPDLPFTMLLGHEPGSLPRLRFGRHYQLRARLADLAGGGLRPGEPDADEQHSASFPHRRFDPVPAPELLPTRPYVDGEGPGRLVVRSDRGTSAADYAAAHGYPADDLRYLFAPKAPLELALQHGVFDSAVGAAAVPPIDSAFTTAVRADRDVTDIPGAQPHDEGAGSYQVVPATGVDLPWLPDPGAPLFAVGVRSRPVDPVTGTEGTTTGFDGADHLHLQHRWGKWPDYPPVGLRLVAGPAGCTASIPDTGAPRVMTVELGPAEQATLDLVSCPGLADVPNHGVAIWAGADPADSTKTTNQLVYHGHIRTVTPPHTITVVHAVQRPLVDPGGRFVASRQTGDTDAILRITDLVLDVASTGRIDVHAEWSDFEDVITDPPSAPAAAAFATHVGSYDVAYTRPDLALPTIVHTFGDTRRRQVTYTVTAISRFHDFFGRLTAVDPEACTVRVTLPGTTDVPCSERPPAPRPRYTVPAFAWSRSSSGGVHRSTRGGGLRVFLERPWFASGTDERLAVIVSAGSEPDHVSLTGKDPIWTTDAPKSPLRADQVVAALGAVPEALDEAGGGVTAVLHPVTFDAELNCWLADIDLSPLAATSYRPFVRLSLCRYQEHTAVDVPHLSAPVETEPLQLFPPRDLVVTQAAAGITAVLGGKGPDGPEANTVRVELQAATSAATAALGDDAVIGSSGWTTVAATSGALGAQLQLSIPAGETRPLRVLVTEVENYPAQDPGPGRQGTRLVYAETVRLT